MAIKPLPIGPHQAYPAGGYIVEPPNPWTANAHPQVVTPAAAPVASVAVAASSSSDAVTAMVDAYALPTATTQSQIVTWLEWAAVGYGLWWAWKNRKKIAHSFK